MHFLTHQQVYLLMLRPRPDVKEMQDVERVVHSHVVAAHEELHLMCTMDMSKYHQSLYIEVHYY